MRERVAKVFAVGEMPEAPVPAPAEPADPTVLERGRAVFDEAGCARCHRLDGSGNPRYPLDGIGARRPPDGIRAFIVADGDARRALTASVARTKERYRELPGADLDALVTYLAASR